jgi:hypothetical protein
VAPGALPARRLFEAAKKGFRSAVRKLVRFVKENFFPHLIKIRHALAEKEG